MHRVQAIGQRLHQDRALQRQALRHAQGPARPRDRLHRDGGVFGIAAIDVAIEPVAHLPAVDAGADIGDPADPFMAGVEGIFAVIDADLVFARIGRADAASLELDQQLARRRFGNRNLLDLQIADPVQPRDAHQALWHKSSSVVVMRPSACSESASAG